MAIADVSTRSVAELVSLAGRTAVVTGGAQGLGRAIPLGVFDSAPMERFLDRLFTTGGRTNDFRKLKHRLYLVATDLDSGESVEFGDLSKSTQRKLKDKPIDTQHGAHLDWKEIPAGQAEGYASIILEARPGKNAKPLLEFHPDGRIRYTYFVD